MAEYYQVSNQHVSIRRSGGGEGFSICCIEFGMFFNKSNFQSLDCAQPGMHFDILTLS